jgi:hypothetical protein
MNAADPTQIAVSVDLTDDRFTMRAGDTEIADWSRREIRIAAQQDGFHVRAEGEEIILEVEDDAAFALALGLRNAPPLLRRRMSALLRDSANVSDQV